MDKVNLHVLHRFEYQLIGFVVQEGHPETSSGFGKEAKSGKRRAWYAPSISDTVLRVVGTHGSPGLYTHWTSAGC